MYATRDMPCNLHHESAIHVTCDLQSTYSVLLVASKEDTINGPIRNEPAIPNIPADEAIEVETVRMCAGNQIAEIRGPPAIKTGPAKPISACPMFITLRNDIRTILLQD